MTVPSATLPRADYTGNGVLTVYPYAFPIFAGADLTVYVGGVLQALTTQYTVSGAGTPSGGNVTFVTAPGAGVAVSILRSVQAVQGTDLRENDPQPAETLEAGLDRPIMLVQQTQETLGRAPQFSPFSTYKNALLDDPILGNVLRVKSLLPLELEWVAVAPGSVTLPLVLSQGGTGGTDGPSARAGLGVDGHIRKVLTNRTGGALVAGNVVAIDAANDAAVKLGDTAGGLLKYVVAAASIANTAAGDFITAGVIQVGSTGAIARGQYVRKSATTLVVEDSGTAVGVATAAPAGALGIALTAAAGGLVSILLFDQPYTAGIVTITGTSRVKGLTATNNAGTPNTKLDVAAHEIALYSPADGALTVKRTGLSVTNDVSLDNTNANGRDQAGAFAANAFVHFYYVMTSGGTVRTRSSATGPVTGPTLAAGEVAWVYATTVRFDSTSHLLLVDQGGASLRYQGPQPAVFNAASGTSENAVSVGGLVPAEALAFDLSYNVEAMGTAETVGIGARTGLYPYLYGPIGTTGFPGGVIPSIQNVSQQFFFRLPVTTRPIRFLVTGYRVPNGDT